METVSVIIPAWQGRVLQKDVVEDALVGELRLARLDHRRPYDRGTSMLDTAVAQRIRSVRKEAPCGAWVIPGRTNVHPARTIWWNVKRKVPEPG